MARLPRKAGLAGVIMLGVAQTVFLFAAFFENAAGRPAAALPLSPTAMREAFAEVSPEAFVNGLDRRGSLVLVGESKKLGFRPPVVSSSVWDRNGLERVMEDQPDDPDAWVRALRDMNAGVVVVNLSEMARAEASGYVDERLGAEAGRALLERLRVIAVFDGAGVVVARVLRR